METDDNMIDKVFTDGITCGALVEVGEAVDCLMVMFKHIQETELVRDFKKILGPEHNQDVDKFLMLLLVSEVATLTGNFKRRESKDVAKAQIKEKTHSIVCFFFAELEPEPVLVCRLTYLSE